MAPRTVRVVGPLLDRDSLAVGDAPSQQTVTAAEYRDTYRRVAALTSRHAADAGDQGTASNPSAVGAELRLLVPAGSGPLAVQATDLLGHMLFRRAFAGGVLTLEAAARGAFRRPLLAVQTAQGTSTRRVVRE